MSFSLQGIPACHGVIGVAADTVLVAYIAVEKNHCIVLMVIKQQTKSQRGRWSSVGKSPPVAWEISLEGPCFVPHGQVPFELAT